MDEAMEKILTMYANADWRLAHTLTRAAAATCPGFQVFMNDEMVRKTGIQDMEIDGFPVEFGDNNIELGLYAVGKIGNRIVAVFDRDDNMFRFSVSDKTRSDDSDRFYLVKQTDVPDFLYRATMNEFDE